MVFLLYPDAKWRERLSGAFESGAQGGQHDGCDRDVVCSFDKGKSGFIRIEVAQAGLSIFQTDADARSALAANAVANLKFKRAALLLRCDLEPASIAGTGDAVADGIFHQRLEDQLRNQNLLRGGIDGPGNGEARAEAHGFEVKILAHEGEFFTQGNEIGAAEFEGAAQER